MVLKEVCDCNFPHDALLHFPSNTAVLFHPLTIRIFGDLLAPLGSNLQCPFPLFSGHLSNCYGCFRFDIHYFPGGGSVPLPTVSLQVCGSSPLYPSCPDLHHFCPHYWGFRLQGSLSRPASHPPNQLPNLRMLGFKHGWIVLCLASMCFERRQRNHRCNFGPTYLEEN